VSINSCRRFLFDLCLILAGDLLSLARKLYGPSVAPAPREVFIHPAVALLFMAAISLPLPPCADRPGSLETASDLTVGSSPKDAASSVFPPEIAGSPAAAAIEISSTQI
jgi:hypothetical protein